MPEPSPPISSPTPTDAAPAPAAPGAASQSAAAPTPKRRLPPTRFIVVSSYPRSGNNWLGFMLAHVARALDARPVLREGVPMPNVYKAPYIYDLDYMHATGIEMNLFGLPHHLVTLKTHLLPGALREALPEVADRIEASVTIIRHPLDIVVSLFNFLHLGGETSFEEARATGAFDEHVDSFIEHRGYPPYVEQGLGTWPQSCTAWADDAAWPARRLWVSYRRLLLDTPACFTDLCRRLELPITAEHVTGAIESASVDRIRGIFGQKFVLHAEDGYFRRYLSEAQIEKGLDAFGELVDRFGL